MNPNTKSFFIALIFSLTLLRLLWLFESHLIYQLFSGYELDHTLGLHKSEKNIFELIYCCNQISNKVFTTNNEVAFHTEEGVGASSKKLSQKDQEKFSYLKNPEEVAHEIDRIKDEIRVKQHELSSLENMMFAFIQESSSSASHQLHAANDHNNQEEGGPSESNTNEAHS